MDRKASSVISFELSYILRNTMDDGEVVGIGPAVGNFAQGTLKNGNQANQIDRAWSSAARKLAGGTSETLDLRNFTGLDIGGGLNNDAIGLQLIIEEIVTLAIKNISGTGLLEITPGSTNPFNAVSSQTVANGNALAAGGVRLWHQPGDNALDISPVKKNIKVTAVGGDVTYGIWLSGRSDDDVSSSSSTSSSTSSSRSSSSKSSSSVSSSSTLSSSSSSTSSPSSTSTMSSVSSSSSKSGSSTSTSSSSSSKSSSTLSSTSSLSSSSSTSSLSSPSSSSTSSPSSSSPSSPSSSSTPTSQSSSSSTSPSSSSSASSSSASSTSSGSSGSASVSSSSSTLIVFQGPNAPINANGSGSWSNANGAKAGGDSSFAVAIVDGATGVLRVNNFGFSIPAGKSIKGIEVDISRKSDGSTVDSTVSLDIGGTLTGTNKASGVSWPASLGNAQYGDLHDTWGAAWTPTIINSSTFGVTVEANNNAGLCTASIDGIAVVVWYD